jgi:hypothetical protein
MRVIYSTEKIMNNALKINHLPHCTSHTSHCGCFRTLGNIDHDGLDGDRIEDTFAEDTFEPNQSIQSGDPTGDIDDNTQSSQLIQGTENVLPSNQNESAGNQSVPSPRSITARRSFTARRSTILNKKRRMKTYLSEVVSIMKDNNRLRSQLIQNPPTVSHSNCEHDECEMLFLSLARTVKKLAPAEQVKVKMGVSKIVFLAELNSTKNITQFNNNYQYQHLPSPSTIDSSGSFSSAANTPTPTPNVSPAPQQE